MSKKQQQIIEIADFLFKNPSVNISQKISVFCSKFQKTERTVWSYVAEAKKHNISRLQSDEKVKNEVRQAEIKETVKSAIADRNECLEILTSIARGAAKQVPTEKKVENKEVVFAKYVLQYPSDKERVLAIQAIAKIDGWEAAIKTDTRIVLGTLTPEQRKAFLEVGERLLNQNE